MLTQKKGSTALPFTIFAVNYPFLLAILNHAPYLAVTLSELVVLYLISIKIATKKYMAVFLSGIRSYPEFPYDSSAGISLFHDPF